MGDIYVIICMIQQQCLFWDSNTQTKIQRIEDSEQTLNLQNI